MFRQGIVLYAYQRESVDFLRETEDRGSLAGVRNHVALNEPFGSGKTFIILALIMETPLAPYRDIAIYDRLCDRNSPSLVIAPRNANQIIRPTAIIVSRSVYAQYLQNIVTYTNLRVIGVRDVRDCGHLIENIMSGDINSYDVVLIKHGDTCAQQVEKRTNLCRMINEKVFPLVWSRVVYDDTDAIESSTCLRAISSIFVTGDTSHRYHYRCGKMTTYVHGIMSHDTRRQLCKLSRVAHIGNIDDAGMIWAHYGHTSEEIARSTTLYGISWRTVDITREDVRHASDLIARLAGDNRALLDMINSDACEAAAREMHIESTSPHALFAAVLGAQRADHETISARIMCCETFAKSGASLSEIEDDESAIFAILDEAIVARAKRTLSDEDRKRSLSTILSANIDELRERIVALERGFERIAENVADQTCLICYDSLVDAPVLIVRCCGFIMCARCCMHSARFVQRPDTAELVGTCPQCRRAITKSDLIMIKGGGDRVISLIGEAKKAETSLAVAASVSTDDVVREVEFKDDTGGRKITISKIDYILALIGGEPIVSDSTNIRIVNERDHRIMRTIEGLMVGDCFTDDSARPVKEMRVIICASVDDTIASISERLREIGVAHDALHGSVYNFANILQRFARGDVRILLLNVRDIWSGVDLQMATDIVIVSAEWMDHLGQVIGRAQRIGRTCSLRIHILNYVAPH